MRYQPFGPFRISTTDSGFVDSGSKRKNSEFWTEVEESVPGLMSGKGCYVFCTGVDVNLVPWYVGQARSASGFFGEVFQPHKLVLYHSALERYQAKPTPNLIFVARLTETEKFAKSVPSGELDWLEKLMIGAAYRRNTDLTNIKDTKLLKTMLVPGFFGNGGIGSSSTLEARALRRCLG